MVELQRGTWMFFGESVYYIPLLLFYIFPNFYAEIGRTTSKHLTFRKVYLKSIPFLVFATMCIGAVFRIAAGFTAYHYDSDAPHRDRATMFLYSFGIQFLLFEFYFISILWIKLGTVFYSKEENLPLGRIRIIDVVVFLNIGFSLCFYTFFNIIQCILNDRMEPKSWDMIWRIFFLVNVTILAIAIGYFGIKILVQLTTSRLVDQLLINKVKAILALTIILGAIIWVCGILYLTMGIERKPQDWINLVIFIGENINIYCVPIVIGRSYLCKSIRVRMGFPDIIDSNSSTSNETSLTVSKANSHKSVEFSSTREAIDSSNIDISVDQQ